jgi:hypothetical protein
MASPTSAVNGRWHRAPAAVNGVAWHRAPAAVNGAGADFFSVVAGPGAVYNDGRTLRREVSPVAKGRSMQKEKKKPKKTAKK